MRKVADGSSGDIVTLFPTRSRCTGVGTTTAANAGGASPIVNDTHELKPLVPEVDIDNVRT